MPTTPAINTIVTITARDINNNNIAKTFNSVGSMNFDYNKGMVRIIDLVQGEFFFSLLTITTLTYTVVSGVGGTTTVVMS